MARLTEIQDGDDARTGPSLTQHEREQILHKSGIIEKLGLPKDFVTMDESQAQLDALNRSANAKQTAGSDDDDSEDDYGVQSDHELDGDDTANRLMQEQQATEMSPQVEGILDLVIWTMPFGFVYTLLDVLVRQQYGETVGVSDEAVRLIRALPLLAFFIHFSKYPPFFFHLILLKLDFGLTCSAFSILHRPHIEATSIDAGPLVHHLLGLRLRAHLHSQQGTLLLGAAITSSAQKPDNSDILPILFCNRK